MLRFPWITPPRRKGLRAPSATPARRTRFALSLSLSPSLARVYVFFFSWNQPASQRGAVILVRLCSFVCSPLCFSSARPDLFRFFLSQLCNKQHGTCLRAVMVVIVPNSIGGPAWIQHRLLWARAEKLFCPVSPVARVPFPPVLFAPV